MRRSCRRRRRGARSSRPSSWRRSGSPWRPACMSRCRCRGSAFPAGAETARERRGGALRRRIGRRCRELGGQAAGRSNVSLTVPSAATVTSAEWSHASLLSSSTTTCTVEPAVQSAPLRGPCRRACTSPCRCRGSAGPRAPSARERRGRVPGCGIARRCRELGCQATRKIECVADGSVGRRCEVGGVGPRVALVIVDDDVHGRAGRPVRAAQSDRAPGCVGALVAGQGRARRRRGRWSGHGEVRACGSGRRCRCDCECPGTVSGRSKESETVPSADAVTSDVCDHGSPARPRRRREPSRPLPSLAGKRDCVAWRVVRPVAGDGGLICA